MNKWKNLLIAISSNRIWFITFMCLDLFFIFLAWLAYPEYFTSYVALIIFVSLAALTIPITISIKKSNKADVVFHSFLLEPDDTNEYLLCEIVPALLRPYVRELGQHLRTQQEYVNEQKIKISDYEQYIENWAHEIKKPLSLMTLLLDNRKNEMSPLVHAAAKLAACDEFIARLPDGYQTLIGENGKTLSGGERQRLSIARAFLKNAPVILLDESTASIDPENETRIQQAISRLIENKTVLIIAHKLRTVAGCDKIVVLEQGNVAEEGTHDALMKENGLYHRLYTLQNESLIWKVRT